MNAQGQDWDDRRLFLAVARVLGVTHSTVFRRIGAFERRLGVRLLVRLSGGYVLTAAGEEMRDSVTRIEEEIAALALTVAGQDQRPGGTIRITTTDLLAVGLLPRHVAAFRARWPGIDIEVIVADTMLDLTRRKADVALRIGNPGQEALVGRLAPGQRFLAGTVRGLPVHWLMRPGRNRIGRRFRGCRPRGRQRWAMGRAAPLADERASGLSPRPKAARNPVSSPATSLTTVK